MTASTEIAQMTAKARHISCAAVAIVIAGSLAPNAILASGCPCPVSADGETISQPAIERTAIDPAAIVQPTSALTAVIATTANATSSGMTASMAASGTVDVDGGSVSTADPTLHLALTATGFGTGVQMRFSLDGGATWTAYKPFAPTHDLPLPAKTRWGTVSLAAQFTDDAGTTASASDAITYVEAPTATMALAPQYVIKATLDYSNARVTATEIVDVTNNSGLAIGHLDFSVLARHFGEMSVRTVTVDGHPVSVSYPNDADLRVPLGYNLRPAEGARAVISFTSHAGPDISTSLAGRLSKANGVMQVSSWHPVLSDGHGLRYPGDSQYTVSAAYRLELTHASNVVIAAPGTLVSSTATSKVITLSHARELAFAASPAFARTYTTTANGIHVYVYYLPGTAGVATARNTAATAIERYSANLGVYPYSRLVVAQSPRPSSGNEYSGIVFVGSSGLGNVDVVAHETAHQWWYGIVGDDQIGEPWLDEAFAEFSARYFFGRQMPRYCSARVVNSSIYAFPNAPAPVTSSDCGSYDQTIYFKGSTFLAGLRSRLGSAAFLAALRAIVAQNRYGVVRTDTARATFLRYATDKAGLNEYMSLYLR